MIDLATIRLRAEQGLDASDQEVLALLDRIAELEHEVAARYTASAYQQACAELHHWREEARRLGAGEEPRRMSEAE